MTLQIVPTISEVEHKAVCSIDGEPWPCKHSRQMGRILSQERWGLLCRECGKVCNAYTSLRVDRGLDGQAVYFHDRKRCRPAAKRWWDENVKPFTGREFHIGYSISDLIQYIGAKPAAVI